MVGNGRYRFSQNLWYQGAGVDDAAFLVNQLIDKTAGVGSTLYLASFDVKSAFDQIGRTRLLQTNRNRFGKEIAHMIHTIYENCWVRV